MGKKKEADPRQCERRNSSYDGRRHPLKIRSSIHGRLESWRGTGRGNGGKERTGEEIIHSAKPA